MSPLGGRMHSPDFQSSALPTELPSRFAEPGDLRPFRGADADFGIEHGPILAQPSPGVQVLKSASQTSPGKGLFWSPLNTPKHEKERHFHAAPLGGGGCLPLTSLGDVIGRRWQRWRWIFWGKPGQDVPR